MSFRFFEKTYPGEVPRPSVETQYSSAENLFIAATPWGSKDAVNDLKGIVREYLNTTASDIEATTPFAKLPGLSHTGNILRVATLLANDSILKKHNIEAYNTGCEACL